MDRTQRTLLAGWTLLACTAPAPRTATADNVFGEIVESVTLDGAFTPFPTVFLGSADLPRSDPNAVTDSVGGASVNAEVAPAPAFVNPNFSYPTLGVTADVSGEEAAAATSLVVLSDRIDLTGGFTHPGSEIVLAYRFDADINGDAYASLTLDGTASFSGTNRSRHAYQELDEQGESAAFLFLHFQVPNSFVGTDVPINFQLQEYADAEIAPLPNVSEASGVDAFDPASFEGFLVLDAGGHTLPGFTMTTSGGTAVPEFAPDPAELAESVAAIACLLLAKRQRRR